MPETAGVEVRVPQLAAAIADYEERGFRLDTIMPADEPSEAWLSQPGGPSVHLRSDGDGAGASDESPDGPAFTVVRAIDGAADEGRAGMAYRDLLPSRLGGHLIASHIEIEAGGPVQDYPHFHEIGFQVIVCVDGWADVVYDGQGPAFRMHPGDCVLQPPGLRHQVLESSRGFGVVEVASPARHPTHRDHDVVLPSHGRDASRLYEGQRFVRHVAATGNWRSTGSGGCTEMDSGIEAGSAGAGSVRFLALDPGATTLSTGAASIDVGYVTNGTVTVTVDETFVLQRGDSFTAAEGADAIIENYDTAERSELLLITVPGRT